MIDDAEAMRFARLTALQSIGNAIEELQEGVTFFENASGDRLGPDGVMKVIENLKTVQAILDRVFGEHAETVRARKEQDCSS